MKTRVVRLYEKKQIRIDSDDVTPPGPGEVLLAMGAGGICGSDLHYYHEGCIGDIIVREPIILGHEAAGTVEMLGPGVDDLKTGDRVALNPSTPCFNCKFCQAGLHQHCLDMRFLGSAMRMPHMQGAFREHMVVARTQCEPVSTNTPVTAAAVAEPLAVCLHAANRAGNLAGKKVIITGAGPIGCLCAAVASQQGASEILVTDIQEFTLNVARKMGATTTINVNSDPQALEQYQADKGYFEIGFECSSAPSALQQIMSILLPQATLVQVGIAGQMPVPFGMLVPRELTIKGSFRFHAEFGEAVKMIDAGVINTEALITQVSSIEDAQDAFELASDRGRAVKVLLQY